MMAPLIRPRGLLLERRVQVGDAQSQRVSRIVHATDAMPDHDRQSDERGYRTMAVERRGRFGHQAPGLHLQGDGVPLVDWFCSFQRPRPFAGGRAAE
jgi:hypothetical protein